MQRRLGGLPPFGRLAAIVVSAEDRGAAEAHARALARAVSSPARGRRTGASRRLAGSRKTTRSSCSARPRRRSRSCASAIGSVSPPRRRDLPTCKRIPARDAGRGARAARRGSRRDRRRSAEFSLRLQTQPRACAAHHLRDCRRVKTAQSDRNATPIAVMSGRALGKSNDATAIRMVALRE